MFAAYFQFQNEPTSLPKFDINKPKPKKSRNSRFGVGKDIHRNLS